MKRYILLSTVCLVLWNCTGRKDVQNQDSLKMIRQVDFSHVKITDNFWSPRLDKHVSATLPVCINQIENQTGRMQNFVNAAIGKGEHSGIFFDDSDVYKALEGIAYSLINNPNPELERKADEWIDKIAAAQQEDGYINTYYTLTGLENRWTNMDKYEMYCAGHMIEAAVAYYQATGKRKLLDVSIRMADHMISLFGPDKRHWVPGHEEIELALVKLYRITKEQKYLDFAYWLLEERGHGYGSKGNEGEWDPFYYQDAVPVRDLESISGHAVRCMYLYCGMADVAALKHDTAYIAAMDRLWDDVVLRNMYVTGGIGSSKNNEGFTDDYDLPNLEAYCETCASVGMVYWNQRMNQFTGDSKYIDVLERSMYNGALAGVSLSGDRFFYVNPLESKGDHHRQEWYGCACCPSQISRFLPSIGNYIYGISVNALWVNLFIGNTTQLAIDGNDVILKQETNYPWDGLVKFSIASNLPLNKELRIRIPGWCKSYSLSINDKDIYAPIEKGYAVISNWKSGDIISLNMDMPVEKVAADPRVKQNVGKRAVQRGPLVYCLEEIDNKKDFDRSKLTTSTHFKVQQRTEFLGGITTIQAVTENQQLLFLPYYAWDNREAGKMKVWIDYQE